MRIPEVRIPFLNPTGHPYCIRRGNRANVLALGHEFEPFHMEAEIATDHSHDWGCYALRRGEWESNGRYNTLGKDTESRSFLMVVL